MGGVGFETYRFARRSFLWDPVRIAGFHVAIAEHRVVAPVVEAADASRPAKARERVHITGIPDSNHVAWYTHGTLGDWDDITQTESCRGGPPFGSTSVIVITEVATQPRAF